jgi:hypothetical protein
MVRVCRADSPRVPGGQSACTPRTVRFSGFTTGGSVGFNGQSAAQAGRSAVPVRTVSGTLADSPLGSCVLTQKVYLAPNTQQAETSWLHTRKEPRDVPVNFS